jgi:uncharacterized iron-regulated membrane protein
MSTQRRPPVIDMTPEGEFRDAHPARPAGTLDRILARLGAAGILVAAGSMGLLLAGLAILAIGILLPVAILAGAVGAGSLWWRARRARQGGQPPSQGPRFVIIRR